MSTAAKFRETGNLLLDRLPENEFDSLEPMLQRVTLSLKQVLHQYEAEITHVHFPVSSLVSLLTVLEEDDPVEAGTVGNEGFVGLPVYLGIDASPHRTICQLTGESLRLPAGRFLQTIESCEGLARLVKRYVAFTLRGSSQTLACNALHTVEARACHWLLRVHDQAGRDEFSLTQEFLAYMLGVRRQTVTVVAGALQSAGLINYRRGVITIIDRPRLEEASCECYATIRDYYARVMK